jgi:hypothetical protein
VCFFFIVRKTTSQEHTILTILYLASAKNIDSWHARKWELQCALSSKCSDGSIICGRCHYWR